MNDDTNKTCVRCSKDDCEKCVQKNGQNFCCQTCCDEYKKDAKAEKKEEPVNVCRFC